MAKTNAMLAKIEAKYAAMYEAKLAIAKANYLKQLDMALQQSSDAALMAADDTFDVDEESAEKFYAAHVNYVNEISRMIIEDAEDDTEIVWSKASVDKRLLQIVGKKNFAPWDERYKVGKEEKHEN